MLFWTICFRSSNNSEICCWRIGMSSLINFVYFLILKWSSWMKHLRYYLPARLAALNPEGVRMGGYSYKLFGRTSLCLQRRLNFNYSWAIANFLWESSYNFLWEPSPLQSTANPRSRANIWTLSLTITSDTKEV